MALGGAVRAEREERFGSRWLAGMHEDGIWWLGAAGEGRAPAAHELVEVAVEALEHEVQFVLLAHHFSQAHDVRVVHLPQRLQHNHTIRCSFLFTSPL